MIPTPDGWAGAPAAAWPADAACSGLAPAFDAESWTAEATYAVRVCWPCPLLLDCERRALAEGASGVRAGRVWRDGVPVDVLEPLPHMSVARCGTASGYGRHRRLGEEPCEQCTVARAVYDARQHQRRAGRPAGGQVAENTRLATRMVAAGWTNRRIAAELGVHERTVTRIRARLREERDRGQHDDGEAA